MNHRAYEYHFCPVCSGRLQSKVLKHHEPARLVCAECNFIFYLDPKLVACSLVEIDKKLVLLKRGIDPQKGKWVMPGGYVDQGEKVEDAARRETEEECGIIIRIHNLLGVYSYVGRPGVVVAYLAEHMAGELMAGDETLEFRLFKPVDIPWNDLAFSSTVDALKDYCELKGIPVNSHRYPNVA